jgi:hypothetical protein
MITEERNELKQLSESQNGAKQLEEQIKTLNAKLQQKEAEANRLKVCFSFCLSFFLSLIILTFAFNSIQMDLDEGKSASLKENRLLASALYELGLEYQRLKAPKAPIPLGADVTSQQPAPPRTPTTVLAKQRSDHL